MTHPLHLSRTFKCDAKTLFNAIGEGMLIKCTGAIPEKTTIDFRQGGQYSAAWESCEETHGEFLEIIPNEKVVFTWNKKPNAESPFESKVTVRLVEANGATALHLSHEGLPATGEKKSHEQGWQHTLKGMYSELQSFFAKLEGNETGLDANFSIGETIKAPLATVFEHVKDASHLQKYFEVKMNASFEKGKTLTWDFEGHPTFELHVHELIENELIKFQWGETHVAFTFFSVDDGTTRVRIHATGFKPDQSGLNDAFNECNGWTAFLTQLRFYIEK